jgi:hypothetical protein
LQGSIPSQKFIELLPCTTLPPALRRCLRAGMSYQGLSEGPRGSLSLFLLSRPHPTRGGGLSEPQYRLSVIVNAPITSIRSPGRHRRVCQSERFSSGATRGDYEANGAVQGTQEQIDCGLEDHLPAGVGHCNRTRRPPSLPSPCGVFPGLSWFPHFERDPRGPDIHKWVGTGSARRAGHSPLRLGPCTASCLWLGLDAVVKTGFDVQAVNRDMFRKRRKRSSAADGSGSFTVEDFVSR